MSGSLGQARRRSASDGRTTSSGGSGAMSVAVAGSNGDDDGGANVAAVATLKSKGGGPTYEVVINPPSREAIVALISSKKRDTPLVGKAGNLEILKLIIASKSEWIKKAEKIADKAVSEVAVDLLDKIPSSINKHWKMEDIGNILFDTHHAIKNYLQHVGKGQPLTRHTKGPFDSLDEIVKYATHVAQQNELSNQNDQLPKLTYQEANRGYLKDGYLPKTLADHNCIFCGHCYVDEPNTNMTIQEDFSKALREYQAKKDAAKAAGNTFNKKTPAAADAYLLCHCFQLRCTSTSLAGSTCPIQCIDPSTGVRYPIENNMCSCPVCHCQCRMAYKLGAGEIIALKQQLDTKAAEQQEELDIQSSRQQVSFVCAEAMRQTLSGFASLPGRTRSQITGDFMQTEAESNAALAVAKLLDPDLNKHYLKEMRGNIGKPTTKVHLPVPISIGGQMVDSVDTRMVSANKSGHRARENHLTLDAEDSDLAKKARVPIHPYGEAYTMPHSTRSAKLAAHSDGSYLDGFLSGEDADIASAIEASLATHRGKSGGNRIVLDYSPMVAATATAVSTATVAAVAAAGYTPPPKATTSKPKKDLLSRVKRKATDRSLMMTEVADVDTPNASPDITFASPLAQEVLKLLGNQQQTFAADMVRAMEEKCEDDGEEPDSQEAY